jgi:hypothetical protein
LDTALLQCNTTQTVIATIHDARKFCIDLAIELRRLRSPRYPQREFFRALERADNADRARAVTTRNGSGDADYFDRQHTFEMPEQDRDPDPRFLGKAYSGHRSQLARAARITEGICP